MKQPQHISEVLHQLVLNNPDDPYAQILRHCPFIQIEMLQAGICPSMTSRTKKLTGSVTL